jgi:hypothetical protein
MRRARSLLLLFAGALSATAEPKPLETFANCTVVPTAWADGDSFRIRTTTGAENHRYRTTDKALALVEEIITRWKKDDLCEPEEVLILRKQSDIARSALGERRVLLDRNLREVTEPDVPADSIRHTSINKAKGLDARASILLGLPPFAE